MAAVIEQIQLNEDNLEEFTAGLEVIEDTTEKIFYIDEHCE